MDLLNSISIVLTVPECTIIRLWLPPGASLLKSQLLVKRVTQCVSLSERTRPRCTRWLCPFSGLPSRGMPRHVWPQRRLEPLFRRVRVPWDLPHRSCELSSGESAVPCERGHKAVRGFGRCPDRLGARQSGIDKYDNTGTVTGCHLLLFRVLLLVLLAIPVSSVVVVFRLLRLLGLVFPSFPFVFFFVFSFFFFFFF